MNEKQTNPEDSNQNIRPTKKQQELLQFIEAFIAEHGYSPSYREIMNGLEYTSVATVALHISNLIKRGHLIKRDRSARSLEVVKPEGQPKQPAKLVTNQIAPGEEKWLIEKIEQAFIELEKTSDELQETAVDQLYVLVGALRVLGLEGAAQSFLPRLIAIKKRQAEPAK